MFHLLYMAVDGTIQCPHCRERYVVPGGNADNFPKNFALLYKLSENVSSKPGSTAEEQDEVVMNVGSPTLMMKKSAAEEMNDNCEQHPKRKIEFYCKKCALPVCCECVQEKHIDHKTESLSAIQAELRRDLNEIAEMAAKRITSLHQTGIDLEKTESNIKEDIYNAKKRHNRQYARFSKVLRTINASQS